MYVLMFMCNFILIPCQLNSTTARLLVFMTERNRRSKKIKLLVYDELNDQRERSITYLLVVIIVILLSCYFCLIFVVVQTSNKM